MTLGLVFHLHSIFQEQIHLAIPLNSAGQFLINFYVQSNLDGSNSTGLSVRVRPIHGFEQYLDWLFSRMFMCTLCFPRRAHFYRLKRTVHVSSVAPGVITNQINASS